MWQKPASEKDVWEECTFGNNLKSAWKAHQHWMPNAVFDCIFCLGKHPRETRKVRHSLACPKQREAWTEWVRGHQTPEGSCQSSNCCTVLQSLSADRLLNSNHGHQADKGFREQIFRSNLWLQRGIVPFFMRIKNPLLDQKHVSTQVHQRRHSNTSLKMLTSLFLIEEDSARRKFTSTKLPQTSMSTHRSTVSSRQHPKSGGSSCPPVFETPICRPFFWNTWNESKAPSAWEGDPKALCSLRGKLQTWKLAARKTCLTKVQTRHLASALCDAGLPGWQESRSKELIILREHIPRSVQGYFCFTIRYNMFRDGPDPGHLKKLCLYPH